MVSTQSVESPAPHPLPGTQTRLGKLVGRPAFWVAFVLLIAGLAILRNVTLKAVPELPVFGEVPGFELVDQQGHAFSADQVRGKIWVAGFMFTRCATICPRLTRCMSELQHRTRNLGDAFRMVSFSVDPENDTPPVLAAYAKKYQASPRIWAFLTGAPEQVKGTVVAGMKIAMGREGPLDDPNSIFHGTKLVLIDTQMKIRGYYECEDEAQRRNLIRDIRVLVSGR